MEYAREIEVEGFITVDQLARLEGRSTFCIRQRIHKGWYGVVYYVPTQHKDVFAYLIPKGCPKYG